MNRDERTYKIIGAAIEVHKELGCGFLEAVYQEALEREFTIQRIPFKSQPIIHIRYKEQLLNKTYQPDFISYNEQSQIINYLKASGFTIGLLINFGANSLEYKRLIYTHKAPQSVKSA